MMDISVIIKNYPNILEVFTQEWFEKEITKDNNEMHLLAKQFTFTGQDGSSLDSHSLQYIDYLEKILKDVKDEINSKRKHFEKIDNCNTIKISAEKNSLVLKLNDEKNKVTLETDDGRTDDFIAKIGNGKLNVYENSNRIGKIKFQQPSIYRDKLVEESTQLSKSIPGIIALYLGPSSIPERKNIIRGFGFDRVWEKNGTIVHIEEGEHIIDNSMISAVLLYIRYFDNKYNIVKELYLNPKADNQLPDSLITKFRDCGTEIIIPVEYNE